ncbi:MAG TPA: hypothetical protein VFQ92_07160, partial [Blastocatellia bacterium]|nr:hypothetical protein [Blastocatellia bacterium]
MPDDNLMRKSIETDDGLEDHTSTVMRRIYARLRTSPRAVILIAIMAVVTLAMILFLLWPRPEKVTVAVETPPAVEGKHAGEDHDEHSQEGVIEVND